MNYTIAIPSYRRPETLKKKTMNLLQNHQMDPSKIYIFVADDQEREEYENSLDPASYHKLIVGEPGIKNIRNFMSQYFDEGQKVFYMDDDISQMYQNYNNPRIKKMKNKKPHQLVKMDSNYDRSNNYLLPLEDLDGFIKEGFQKAEENQMDNFGVYPIENPYFMKPTSRNDDDFISTKLNYLMGGLTGVFNNREAEKRTLDDKEDYERSIKY